MGESNRESRRESEGIRCAITFNSLGKQNSIAQTSLLNLEISAQGPWDHQNCLLIAGILLYKGFIKKKKMQ